MEKALKIGFITTEDPNDRRSWSGILHYLMQALQADLGEVVALGPLRPQPELFHGQLRNYLGLRLFNKRYNYRDSFQLSKAYARQLNRTIANGHFDLLIAPAGLATIAHLRTEVPIVYVNDRCLAGALDYHKILSGLSELSRKEGIALEERALGKASLTIYGSHWAADAAREYFPQHASKVHVLPFGANLEKSPARPVQRDAPGKPLKMLFLGVMWEEKGGPIAYETLQELKRRRMPTQLVVCGCDPPPECTDPDLVREGFLNKNDPAQRQKLEEHLRTADLLIVPTRFEAYGIVFCEAAAYGVPVFATRTGGVPTIVQDGKTGYLFGLEEGGAAYADKIQEMLADPRRWPAMRKAARERFEQELTWEAFVQHLKVHIEETGLINRSR